MGDVLQLYEMHQELVHKHNTLVDLLIKKGILEGEKEDEKEEGKKKEKAVGGG
jgi:hypothetical protein